MTKSINKTNNYYTINTTICSRLEFHSRYYWKYVHTSPYTTSAMRAAEILPMELNQRRNCCWYQLTVGTFVSLLWLVRMGQWGYCRGSVTFLKWSDSSTMQVLILGCYWRTPACNRSEYEVHVNISENRSAHKVYRNIYMSCKIAKNVLTFISTYKSVTLWEE